MALYYAPFILWHYSIGVHVMRLYDRRPYTINPYDGHMMQAYAIKLDDIRPHTVQQYDSHMIYCPYFKVI